VFYAVCSASNAANKLDAFAAGFEHVTFSLKFNHCLCPHGHNSQAISQIDVFSCQIPSRGLHVQTYAVSCIASHQLDQEIQIPAVNSAHYHHKHYNRHQNSKGLPDKVRPAWIVHFRLKWHSHRV